MNSNPDHEPTEYTEPANLRFLRRLVTVLTITMIGGFLTMIALFVIRLPSVSPPTLPDQITLPEGVSAEAVTVTQDQLIVVAGDEILIFSRASGDLKKRIPLGED
jgi:hypothetical protein